MYREVQYWNNRINPNSAPIEGTKKHIKFVKEQIKTSSKIIDFGCGVGRIFSAYEEMKTVEGYDISKLYQHEIIKESKKYKFKFNLHIEDDILKTLPYKNNEFDCSIAVSVLLHQKPEHILNVMHELARISKKVIVVSWYKPNIPFTIPYSTVDTSQYCFNYDYLRICKLHCWNIEYFIDNKSIYFIYSN